MEEPRKTPTNRIDGTPEQIDHAHQIVAEELGNEYYLEYTHVKNVGIHGDSRVYGDTVFIYSQNRSSTLKLLCDPDLMDRVSSRICNESWAVTRVLVDLTLLGIEE